MNAAHHNHAETRFRGPTIRANKIAKQRLAAERAKSVNMVTGSLICINAKRKRDSAQP